MSKPLAFFFAVLTAVLLVGISSAIAYRNPVAILLLCLATILTIGIGFQIKKASRKRH